MSYALGVGFYNSNGTRNVWFTLTGTANVVLGQTTTVTFNNPSIGQMLSTFHTAGWDWNGTYYDNNAAPHVARFHFGNNGSWSLYDGTVNIGNGAVSLVAWPKYASIVTFKLCSTCPNIDLAYPFGEFYYRNGLESWPIIDYVAQ